MQLTKTASAVRNLGNEGAGAERKIGGLVKMLGGLITVQSIDGIISLGEGYNEYAERVRMAPQAPMSMSRCRNDCWPRQTVRIAGLASPAEMAATFSM
ncbi:MAG TPA: hypothetical protein DEO64_08790 [Alcaligenes faecalis]|nr:hypothetical protein [Alcaligenes faecalis]